MTKNIAVALTSENCNKFLKYVILKEKFHKNFDTSVHIFPKDKEILKYWKYRKHIKFWSEKDSSEKLFFDTEETFKNLLLAENFDIFSESIIFEFPDEETAFYFKMKFC